MPFRGATAEERVALVQAGHYQFRASRAAAYGSQDTVHLLVEIEPAISSAAAATTTATAIASDSTQSPASSGTQNMCVPPRVHLTFYKNGHVVLGGPLLLPACFLQDKPNLFVFSTLDDETDCCELFGAEVS